MDSNSLLVRVFRRLVVVSSVALLLSLYVSVLIPVQTAAASSLSNTSFVRVIHASPYVGTADVFVDGKALLSSFQFAAVTDYVPVPAGVHKVQIALIGKGIDASVINQDMTVDPGYAYTVAALGASPDALSLQAFIDNNQVVANQAKVRVYHLSPDAGTINVNVGGDANLNNVGYPKASDYVTTSAGPCTFTFTDPKFNMNLPLTTTLNNNAVTSVFAVGLFNGSPHVKLVSAQTQGIPGLPKTGGDPNLHPDSVIARPIFSWLLATAALFLIGAGVVMRRLKRVV